MSSTVSDFAHAVPPPLNTLILEFAGSIAYLKWLLDVVCWKKGHRVESWLLLASWWATCIFGPYAVKYGLPIIVLTFTVVKLKKRHKAPLSTEDTFNAAISDLLAIQSAVQIPRFTLPPLPPLPPLKSLRVVAIITLPYWILTYFVRTRVIVALLGTVALIWQAKWARNFASIIWKSAWFRAGIARLWALMTGEPRPRTAFANKALSRSPSNNSTEIRLLFTIFENQRWWMGLDWTAALLPAERPSWSTNSLQAVSPPTSFSLPGPSTSFIPHPDNPKLRIQRKAVWRWEDTEWKVVINRNDAGSPPPSRPSRVQKPLPNANTENTPTPISIEGTKDTTPNDDSQLLKERIKEKMTDPKEKAKTKETSKERTKERTTESNPSQRGSHSSGNPSEDDFLTLGQGLNDLWTDADGWMFGDNKWEHASDKGGMGKYTRFRRWTRIAVLREEGEEVGPGIMGVVRSPPAKTVISTDVPLPDMPSTASEKEAVTTPSPSSGNETGGTASDRLRQRLQAAIRRDPSSG